MKSKQVATTTWGGGGRKAYPVSHLEKGREGGGGVQPLESS